MQNDNNYQPEIKVVGMLDISSHDHSRRVHDPDGLCPTLTAVAGGTHHIKIFDPTKYRVRKLTPTEYGRLQAFPVDGGWEQVVSDCQAYRQFGNAVTVTVVTAIGAAIKDFLDQRKPQEEVTDLSDIATEEKETIIENAEKLAAREADKTAATETAIKTDDEPSPKINGLEFFSNEELLEELNRRMAAHA
jgi:hypothetical protein